MNYFKHDLAYVDEPVEIGEGAKIGMNSVMSQNVNVVNNILIVEYHICN